MIIGVPKEIKQDEYRVALIPVGAEELTQAVGLSIGEISGNCKTLIGAAGAGHHDSSVGQ